MVIMQNEGNMSLWNIITRYPFRTFFFEVMPLFSKMFCGVGWGGGGLLEYTGKIWLSNLSCVIIGSVYFFVFSFLFLL